MFMNCGTHTLRLTGLLTSTILLAACGGDDDPPPVTSIACEDLATPAGLIAAGLPVADTTVLSAELVPARPASESAMAIPAYCEVVGTMGKHVGVDGNSYATTFRMRMPMEAWNGRFYMYGGGGTNGYLSDGLGAPLAQGFATIGNDGGHDNTKHFDPAAGGVQAFGRDPQARIDLGYNSLDMTARTGKSLIKAFYGEEAHHSYFSGCSNGGREGMVMAQRFPDYFDGILAGAPAFRVPYAGLASAYQIQLAAELVEPNYKSRGSVPNMSDAFSPSDLGLVSQAILDSCDALDNAVDGMVQRFEQCTDALVHPQLDALVCETGKTDACLTPGQVDAVKKMKEGPKDAAGRPLYASWTWDPGLWNPTVSALPAWSFGTGGGTAGTTLVPGAMAMVFTTPPAITPTSEFIRYTQYMDLEATARSFSVTTSLFTESTDQILVPNDPDLSGFKNHGGKLIFFHGMGDGIFSISDTINYYKQMDQALSGAADEFTRLYPMAGMAHCSGGPSTSGHDIFQRLVEWVENGTSPDNMVATALPNSGFAGRTRPLCAYPTVPLYKGTGSIEVAENFICQ
ncbi:MAG: tannase/feruloyl esterase family alpha/beta hydrolase [Pigmentiphaga sp.]